MAGMKNLELDAQFWAILFRTVPKPFHPTKPLFIYTYLLLEQLEQYIYKKNENNKIGVKRGYRGKNKKGRENAFQTFHLFHPQKIRHG